MEYRVCRYDVLSRLARLTVKVVTADAVNVFNVLLSLLSVGAQTAPRFRLVASWR